MKVVSGFVTAIVLDLLSALVVMLGLGILHKTYNVIPNMSYGSSLMAIVLISSVAGVVGAAFWNAKELAEND